MQTTRGEADSSYSFLISVLDGMSGQRHTPTALYPRGKDPRYPLDRSVGGPRIWSEHRLEEKSFAFAGDRARSMLDYGDAEEKKRQI
jgi:hypothetical protein